MNIEQLFKGIAIIIDDEINDGDSSISKIKSMIESRNIPVLAYDDIPNKELINSFEHSSFIVLDWEYVNDAERDIKNVDERISIPSTLQKEKEDELIEFIREILKFFVPVFIFTSHSPDEIRDRLLSENIISDEKNDRIFIKQKNELGSDNILFESIENWLKQAPSVYVLKSWERTIIDAKNKLFIEMNNYSPNWTKIIWDCLNNDSIENKNEFGEFITRNLVNRISAYEFDEEILDCEETASKEELAAVIEGERYISYDAQPEQAYTGDIFKKNDDYYLNIRAQCDLSREANPKIYYIKGNVLKYEDITTFDIHFTDTEDLVLNRKDVYKLDDIKEICKSHNKLKSLNYKFRKFRNSNFFLFGDILENKSEVIIACIAGGQILKFPIKEIYIEEFNVLKEKRIGRLLPPYITRVQQKCSQYIVREGVMPVPISLFEDFE